MALVSSCSQWALSLTRKPSYTKGGKDVTAIETDGEGPASAPTDPTFPWNIFKGHLLRVPSMSWDLPVSRSWSSELNHEKVKSVTVWNVSTWKLPIFSSPLLKAVYDTTVYIISNFARTLKVEHYCHLCLSARQLRLGEETKLSG